jgi:3-hydroxyisobutyrate dehydrogenase
MTVNDASAEAAPGQQTSIGLVGLGNMGAALADAGGLAHDNLGDAVRDASLVILMLPSSDTVEAVVRDPQFTLAAGTTVIDMGSSEPARTQALAAELGQRAITLVDAPVSGGVAGARAGRLTIMVGADPTVLDRLRPVFEPIGNPILVGNVGAGHAVKALNNLLSATHLLSTAEAMAAGQRFGLDPQVMIDVFNRSAQPQQPRDLGGRRRRAAANRRPDRAGRVGAAAGHAQWPGRPGIMTECT